MLIMSTKLLRGNRGKRRINCQLNEVNNKLKAAKQLADAKGKEGKVRSMKKKTMTTKQNIDNCKIHLALTKTTKKEL